MRDRNPTCRNHPGLKVLGSCHSCHDWFCHECLLEGPEYYYCKKQKCRSAFQEEVRPKTKTKSSNCPSCYKKIKGDPKFCSYCGYRLKPITEDETDDLVTIARYGTALEAHLARTKLESRNIDSYVADEHMVSLCPTRDIGWGGVKLKTRQSEVKTAMRIFGNPLEGSFWVPHPLATLVYMFPLIAGIPLLVLLTPFALLLYVVWKFVFLKFFVWLFYT
jgi:hypothetical protein